MTIQLILICILGISIGFLLSYLRRKLVDYITKKYPSTSTTGGESFNPSKFLKGFILTDPVLWTKSIFEIIDLRKIIIYLVIACMILGYGYYAGWQHRPVKVELGYNKEVIMVLDGGQQLHIDKKGNVFLEDTKTGKIIKQISVKDIPNLKDKLAPYGFQLKPFIMAGASYGTGGEGGMEVGAGVSFFRAWKMELDAFITTHPAIYVGASYMITDNAGVGIGVGQSLKDMDDQRIIIYGKMKF
jgi:uncharacterized membrane protein